MQKLNKNFKSGKVLIIFALLALILSPITNVLAYTINQPINISPEDDANSVGFDDVLKTDIFVPKEEGDKHLGTMWELSRLDENGDRISSTFSGDSCMWYTDTNSSEPESSLTTVSLRTIFDNCNIGGGDGVGYEDLLYGQTYAWTVQYYVEYFLDGPDNGTNSDWSSYSTPTSFTLIADPNPDPPANVAPNQPTNNTPANGEIVTTLTPIFSASAFGDADAGDTHLASQWEVIEAGSNYQTTVFRSDYYGDLINLTSIVVPDGILKDGFNYLWRVRYQDNNDNWSAWSEQTPFVINLSTGGETGDDDGIGGDDGSGDTGDSGGGGRRYFVDTTAPSEVSQVVLISVKIDDINQIKINWTNPSDSDFAGTRVYRSNQSYAEVGESGFTLINETDASTNEYSDSSNIEVGQTYYYILRTFDTSNNQENNTNEYSILFAETESVVEEIVDDELAGQEQIIDQSLPTENSVVETESPAETPEENVVEPEINNQINEISSTGLVLSDVVKNPEIQEEIDINNEIISENLWDKISNFFADFWENVSGNLDQLNEKVLAKNFGSLFETTDYDLLSWIMLVLGVVIFLASIIIFRKNNQ